ncbi:hypothetical protein ACFL2Q_17130, partial [Thermodesulfobacteriota bacterium]
MRHIASPSASSEVNGVFPKASSSLKARFSSEPKPLGKARLTHVSHPFSGSEGYFSWHFLELPRQERFEILFRGRKEAPMDVFLKNLSGCDVSFLPIVAAF